MSQKCSVCGDNDLIQTMNSTIICGSCGVESRFLTIGGGCYSDWKLNTMPLIYSRLKRFEKMTDSAVLGCSFLNDNKMLEFLSKHNTFPDINSLVHTIRTCSLKDKRYCSLHLFSRLFCTNHVKISRPNNYLLIKREILRTFTNIERSHKWKYPNSPFFNYRFILIVLLNIFRLERFIIFVKPLQCKRRQQHYIDMLNSLHVNYGDTVLKVQDVVPMS